MSVLLSKIYSHFQETGDSRNAESDQIDKLIQSCSAYLIHHLNFWYLEDLLGQKKLNIIKEMLLQKDPFDKRLRANFTFEDISESTLQDIHRQTTFYHMNGQQDIEYTSRQYRLVVTLLPIMHKANILYNDVIDEIAMSNDCEHELSYLSGRELQLEKAVTLLDNLHYFICRNDWDHGDAEHALLDVYETRLHDEYDRLSSFMAICLNSYFDDIIQCLQGEGEYYVDNIHSLFIPFFQELSRQLCSKNAFNQDEDMREESSDDQNHKKRTDEDENDHFQNEDEEELKRIKDFVKNAKEVIRGWLDKFLMQHV